MRERLDRTQTVSRDTSRRGKSLKYLYLNMWPTLVCDCLIEWLILRHKTRYWKEGRREPIWRPPTLHRETATMQSIDGRCHSTWIIKIVLLHHSGRTYMHESSNFFAGSPDRTRTDATAVLNIVNMQSFAIAILCNNVLENFTTLWAEIAGKM